MKKILIPIFLITLAVGCHRGPKTVPLVNPSDVNMEGVARLPLEGFELIGIQDVVDSMEVSLFNDAPDSVLAQVMPTGKTPAGINVFLVANEDYQILFDAGMGAAKGGRLMSKLEALNVKASDVDAIFLTHLHADHIGGMVQNGCATFPNAQLYISAQEFDAWTNGAMQQRNEQVLEMLSYYAERLNILDNGDTAMGFIVAHVAPGHTPGHTLYELPNVLIAGDLIHAKELQMDYPECCATFDHNKKQAVAARQRYLEYALTHHLVLADMHFPWPCVVDYTE